jgi:predicted Zn finger-like uncharacterized protein
VHIVCDNCGTEYDYDLPQGHSGRNVRFRCSSCGHRFVAVRQEDNPAAPEPAPEAPQSPPVAAAPAPSPAPGGTLLKQAGVTYEIGDTATLQRWIVERRIFREDLVSTGDGQWEIVGLRPDLESFFQVVEAAGLSAVGAVGGNAMAEAWPFRPGRSEPEGTEFEPTEQMDPTDETNLDAPTEEAPTTAASAFGAGASFGSGASFGGGMSFGSGASFGASTGVSFDSPTEEEPRPSPAVRFGDAGGESGLGEGRAPLGGVDAEDVMPAPKEVSVSTILVAVTLVCVGIGLVWGYLSNVKPAALETPPGAVDLHPVDAVPTPASPAPEAAPPPAEPPKVEAPAAEAPKAEPPKEPAAPKPRASTESSTPRAEAPKAESKPRGSAASLIKKGWAEIDAGNYSSAEANFQAAVAASPSSAAAHYGLGYAYEKRRDIANAGNEYCAAQQFNTKDEDLARELTGRLSVIGRTCP